MPPPAREWTRLEPYSHRDSIEDGLSAAIHDPLWLLMRQSQLGELQGEDAASPVRARLRAEATRLTRYHPRGLPSGGAVQGQTLNATSPPLETLVERERVRAPGPSRPRLAAEAGLHFLRLLDPQPAGALREAVLSRFRLQAPPPDPQRPLDGDTRGFLLVTAGRVPDGVLLFAVLEAVRSGSVAGDLVDPFRARVSAGVQAWNTWYQTLSATDRGRVDGAVAAWLPWYQTLFSEPVAAPPGTPAWVVRRAGLGRRADGVRPGRGRPPALPRRGPGAPGGGRPGGPRVHRGPPGLVRLRRPPRRLPGGPARGPQPGRA